MKVKMIVFLICLVIIGSVLKIFINDKNQEKVKIDESELVLKEKKETTSIDKIDINRSEYEDFISIGFSKSQAEKLSNYKEFIGDVETLEELTRIKGFGKASIEKAVKFLYISSDNKYKNKHNINKLDEDELKLLGFTKKEIKFIKKQKIRNNLLLIELIGKDRYNEVENLIKYTD